MGPSDSTIRRSEVEGIERTFSENTSNNNNNSRTVKVITLFTNTVTPSERSVLLLRTPRLTHSEGLRTVVSADTRVTLLFELSPST